MSGVILGLLVPSAASASITSVFGTVTCETVINPQEIGATGASYGGGMSSQLGSLKDRVELLNGELIPWVSPKGTPMKIAATAPELTWTDLAQSRMHGLWPRAALYPDQILANCGLGEATLPQEIGAARRFSDRAGPSPSR